MRTNLKVVLRVLFKQDGSIAAPPELVAGAHSPLGPAIAESAKRAILGCQPFNMLTAEHLSAMERHRDHLRSARHVRAADRKRYRRSIHAEGPDDRIHAIPPVTRRSCCSAPAPPARSSAFAHACAVAATRLDVTQGTFEPMPIALPDFMGGRPADDAEVASGVTQVIAANLKRSGLFAPIDPAAYIERIANIR